MDLVHAPWLTSSLLQVENYDRHLGRYRVLVESSFDLHLVLIALPAQLDLGLDQSLLNPTIVHFVNPPLEAKVDFDDKTP